jgi:DNA-binding transcriptional LysR family regulator
MFLVQCRFGMDVRQLRYLVLLSEELNFTRAAARANVAQPALSRQVRRLEAELGVPLVDRTSRRVRMTTHGTALVDRARRVLAEVEEARIAAREATELLRGYVVIGLSPMPGPVDVPRLLGAFHARHPGIELALREELSVIVANRLRADEIDLAIVTKIGQQAQQGLTLRALAREPLVAMIPPRHHFAGAERLRLRDLRHEPYIAFPTGATIRETVVAAAGDAGFVPRIAFETRDPHRMRALVAEGLGIAIVPNSEGVGPGPEVAVVPLSGSSLVHEVYLASRKGRRPSPAAAALMRHIAAEADARGSAAA